MRKPSNHGQVEDQEGGRGGTFGTNKNRIRAGKSRQEWSIFVAKVEVSMSLCEYGNMYGDGSRGGEGPEGDVHTWVASFYLNVLVVVYVRLEALRPMRRRVCCATLL